MRLILAVPASLALALAVVLSAPPAAADPCMIPLDAVEARIRATVPPAALEIERHAGPDVEPVVRRLNAEPPETDFVADTLTIAYWRDRPGALVLFGLDGCLAGQITLPASRARTLFGEGA